MTDFNWQSTYQSLHEGFTADTPRPVIGITGNYADQASSLAEGYYQSVLQSGAIPLIIPPYEQTDSLADLLDSLDAIIFSGGGDINPLYLGEEPVPQLHGINPVRDRQELLLARMAYNRQLPMLGICRGIQVMAAALGGTLHQDIAATQTVKHSQDLDRSRASHTVSIADGTLLHSIFRTDTLAVNSFHHQAVATVPEGFRISAVSKDGIIEAIESTEHKSVIGVQWHPECFILGGDDTMMPLFSWFKDEAAEYRAAKQVHQHVLSLDSHCDTPMFFGQDIDFYRRDPKLLVDLHKMHEGHLDASIMVAYLKQEARDDESLKAATAKADSILDGIEAMVGKSPALNTYVTARTDTPLLPMIGIARTPDDLYRMKRNGQKAIMLGIENGYAIGRDISNVERFRQRGVVYMTLCHNGDNDLCDSAKGNAEHGGVSQFGAEVIREMNRVGMMVDLSHAAETSFYDALDISTAPIVCSHSSSRHLCDHPRNLTDDQMRRLAQTGGVAQVTFYNGFLRTDGKATILDAIEHINHAIDIMGIDHVGIGTDFDGDGGVPGIGSASEVINITRRLLRQRYSLSDIEKIWGGNFLRLMKHIQQSATKIRD